MKKLLLGIIAAILLSVTPALAQYVSVQGIVGKGGVPVVIGGLPPSATKFLATYPGAEVTVCVTQTACGSLANIYSSATGGAKSNPFTADGTTAAFQFYVLGGTYDLRFSGAGISSPWTLTGFEVNSIQLGNGSTVIDASVQAGTTFDAQVNAGFSMCPAGLGCIVDARGLSGAQSMLSNITYSTPGTPSVLELADSLTLTRATCAQFFLGTGGKLHGQGEYNTFITGNDSCATVGGIYANGISDIEVSGVSISNSGIGPCIDFLDTGDGASGTLSSNFHDNKLGCSSGILDSGYWNHIYSNTFAESPSYPTVPTFAGIVMDVTPSGGGSPNSNHLYDNIYQFGQTGVGVFFRNGYSNKITGSEDYEGPALAVFNSANATQFDIGGDVENVHCNGAVSPLWAASTAYGRGAVIFDGVNGNASGNCEIAVSPSQLAVYAPLSGASTPSWPSVEGTLTCDGGTGPSCTGGVTWEMFTSNYYSGNSAFMVLDAGKGTNTITGAIGQSPSIEDLDYTLNGNISNVIQTTGNQSWGTAGTDPYVQYARANVYGGGFCLRQPSTGNVAGNILGCMDFSEYSNITDVTKGIQFNIPSTSLICTIYGICGHDALRLGTLNAVAGATINGPVTINKLPTPGVPVLATVGTAGSASYTYYLAAHVNGGETPVSASATIATGPTNKGSLNAVTVLQNCSPTPCTGSGSGYAPTNTLTIVQPGASGGTVTVATVNGTGGVLTVNQPSGTADGTLYTAANNLATTGGAGTGAAINITATNYVTINTPTTIGGGLNDPWSGAKWDILEADATHSLALNTSIVGNGYIDYGQATTSGYTASVNTTGTLSVAGLLTLPITTITGVPTCASGTKNEVTAVSDSNSVTWGATYTGSSSSYAVIVCDGSNWTVFAK